MPDVRLPRGGPQTPVLSRVRQPELTKAGLDADRLFGSALVAWRRVEGVSVSHVEVDGAALPRRLLAGPVVEGQWLRFSKGVDGRVEVRVDLKTTLSAESRLASLFERLSG